ncbi:YbaL family putative K(+) efflux transporter [Rhodopseudomonas palustris]|uniref:YbaL family putative K(+) efflux transporter n=1 Tax=Rhodopseudomonas palustris TaxID=1076 RepID=UPI0021F2B797|nr:YbaL family putative K(+) efflux transporter [Rhodopseudomonas palustris]UYO52920.1 Kef family K(+) transporter [Rhodopseudomonas palustris]
MPHNGTMEHNTPLISTIVAGLVLAFAFGVAAQRLKISPLVGYLLAGVVIGPFTPGYVADQSLANELAEIGVILLMFGVGLHFSLKDLLEVRAIAIPGAVVQIGAATVLGAGLGHALGWPFGAGLVFGLALSVASTVVLLRALQERRLVDSERGRIAVGWLIVEDIAMVLTLVLLPAVAGLLKGEATTANWQTVLWPVALTLGKVFAFMVFMLVVGRRIIPWMLHYVAHTGSRELFRLAVLAISLGVAFGAAVLFDVSLALGAFFAGMILSESELSHRAANETLPLRDAFAVLFFVSVGMLVDPGIVAREPLPLLVTVLIIVFGKSIAAFFIVRLFGHPNMTALTISASLAQIGEFSFILAGLGVALGLMPERGRDLVLAGAIISIMLNPVMFVLLDRFSAKVAAAAEAAKQAAKDAAAAAMPAQPRGHIVLVGHGRVGSNVSAALRRSGADVVVIENDDERVARLQREGFTAINGNAAAQEILDEAEIAQAHGLLVAIPNAFEGGQIVAKARAVNPGLLIIARAHSAEEVIHLRSNGANLVIMGEDEIARAMIARLGVDAISSDAAVNPITSAAAPASAGAAA